MSFECVPNDTPLPRRFPKRLVLVTLVVVFAVALAPWWWHLTRVHRTALPFDLLPQLLDEWRALRPPRSPSPPLVPCGPWKVTLLAVDASHGRHGRFLLQLARELSPLLSRLALLLPGLSLDLQARYHTPLRGALSPALLSAAFQPADWALDVTSSRPRADLVVYFADRDPAPYAAFAVGPSAAVALVHCSTDACATDAPHPALAARAAVVLQQQLKAMLGLSIEESIEEEGNAVGLSHEEEEALRERHSAECIEQALGKLASLRSMVEAMPDMEVQDAIGESLAQALRHLSRALRLMRESRAARGREAGEGDALAQGALEAAQASVQAADRAYFDPTLAAAMYYPAEHTFAIYGALYLTTLFTLLSSFVQELRQCRQKRSTAQAATR